MNKINKSIRCMATEKAIPNKDVCWCIQRLLHLGIKDPNSSFYKFPSELIEIISKFSHNSEYHFSGLDLNKYSNNDKRNDKQNMSLLIDNFSWPRYKNSMMQSHKKIIKKN